MEVHRVDVDSRERTEGWRCSVVLAPVKIMRKGLDTASSSQAFGFILDQLEFYNLLLPHGKTHF